MSHVCEGSQKTEKSVRAPEAGVTGGCLFPDSRLLETELWSFGIAGSALNH